MNKDIEKFRRKIRSGKIKPQPAGTLVTGHIVEMNLPVRARCVGHLFETREAHKNKHWQSGFVQGARCLVCRDEVVPIDSSTWFDVATKEHIRQTMRLLKDRARKDKNLYMNLKKRLERY